MDERSATQVEIAGAGYGKDEVRVLRTGASPAHDLTLTLEAEGEFLDSYRSGDNAAVLPSDTLRRHALAECGRLPDTPVEPLVDAIARRLLAANPAFTAVHVAATGAGWYRVGPGCFGRAAWQAGARVRRTRAGDRQGSSELSGLDVLTTTGSGFTGFLRDALTVQADATDRPLCGTLGAVWTLASPDAPPVPAGELADGLLAAFAGRTSNSVQQLLTAVGTSVLGTDPRLASLELRFRSAPLTPVSPPERGGGTVHELGAGPFGLTSVALRRA